MKLGAAFQCYCLTPCLPRGSLDSCISWCLLEFLYMCMQFSKAKCDENEAKQELLPHGTTVTPGWHIDTPPMHLTTGEMQRHLVVYLASVMEQCPVHGPFLVGTCHCENKFDKEKGPSLGLWRRIISRGLGLSCLIPGQFPHRSLPEPLLQHWTSSHEVSSPAPYSQGALHHTLPFLITFPDSFPSSLCWAKCMAMMNQGQCSASQPPLLPYHHNPVIPCWSYQETACVQDGEERLSSRYVDQLHLPLCFPAKGKFLVPVLLPSHCSSFVSQSHITAPCKHLPVTHLAHPTLIAEVCFLLEPWSVALRLLPSSPSLLQYQPDVTKLECPPYWTGWSSRREVPTHSPPGAIILIFVKHQ